MDYIKKVLVLKQITEGFSFAGKTISGIARVEIESNVSFLHLSLINVSSVDNGSYFLYFIDGSGKILAFDLGAKPTTFSTSLLNTPDVEKGFSMGLCYVKDDIPLLISYASCDKAGKSVIEFRKLVCDKVLNERKKRAQTTLPKEDQPYDDEVVATENYYLNDKDLSQKLKIIEELDNTDVRNENGCTSCPSQEEKEEEFANFGSFEDEASLCPSQEYSKDFPYYQSVKEELEDIFLKFPSEPALEKVIDKSKWAKIHYSDTQFYVVGLVSEKGQPKYVCYGVPATYSPNPPKELNGYCSFIPLSVFDMKGDGYWMMFQDAVSGECIKLNTIK